MRVRIARFLRWLADAIHAEPATLRRFRVIDGAKTAAIWRACESVGSARKLASVLGVTPQAVHQWLHGGRPVPPAQCIPIENATGGLVTRYELRPDVFGPAPSEAAA